MMENFLCLKWVLQAMHPSSNVLKEVANGVLPKEDFLKNDPLFLYVKDKSMWTKKARQIL
jgi:hypothetical protein